MPRLLASVFVPIYKRCKITFLAKSYTGIRILLFLVRLPIVLLSVVLLALVELLNEGLLATIVLLPGGCRSRGPQID